MFLLWAFFGMYQRFRIPSSHVREFIYQRLVILSRFKFSKFFIIIIGHVIADQERWTAFLLNGPKVELQYNAINQRIAVSAPGRDAVYFVAPGKNRHFASTEIVRF